MTKSKFFAGLVLGAAAGAALALFISSDKGQEAIDDLKDVADDASGKLKSHFDNLESELSVLIKKGRKYVCDLEKKAAQSLG